jgi:hypothetical protein
MVPLEIGLLPGQNPFAISLNAPSGSNTQLDSAYLPSFTYPMMCECGVSAQSPVQFDLSDLPFFGMDFLQSLGGSLQDISTSPNDEALWLQLGTSPFKLPPEPPFVINESSS